jgi:hypothetical protein
LAPLRKGELRPSGRLGEIDPSETLAVSAWDELHFVVMNVALAAGNSNVRIMSPRSIPYDGPVVFRQDRRKLLLSGLIGIVFVAMGVSFIVHPEFWQTSRHSADSVEIVGWVVAPFFSLCLFAVAVSLVRPTTVKLNLEGIVVSKPWGTYSRPWRAVSDFKIWKYRRNRIVVFNDTNPPNRRLAEINRRLTGATSAMPTALNVGPEQLLAAVEEASERWGPNLRNARGLG